jgi:Na+/H+ antiporter NhaA
MGYRKAMLARLEVFLLFPVAAWMAGLLFHVLAFRLPASAVAYGIVAAAGLLLGPLIGIAVLHLLSRWFEDAERPEGISVLAAASAGGLCFVLSLAIIEGVAR